MSKVIVITGSTRGMGFALADAFLGLGCQVVISGRAQASVQAAVDQLCQRYEVGDIFGSHV
jgi:NAD(P)-dependent dehydrogenase (short-subunit alcohol dehydrogenase family)